MVIIRQVFRQTKAILTVQAMETKMESLYLENYRQEVIMGISRNY
jgi:hypothetical protein